MNDLQASACALFEVGGSSFLCFGGRNSSLVGQMADASPFSYSTETRKWKHVKFSTEHHPSPRYGHAMVTIPNTGIGLLGGAQVNGPDISDEFWVLNTMNMWTRFKTNGLPPLFHHSLSLVDSDTSTKIIAIGGKSSDGKLISTKTVLVYDTSLKNWAQKEVRFPIQERHSHSAAGISLFY